MPPPARARRSAKGVGAVQADVVVDTGEQGCGELIVTVAKRFRPLAAGTVVAVVTYDPGAREDLPAWCRLMGHELLGSEPEGRGLRYFIRKGGG